MSPQFVYAFSDSTALGWNNKQGQAHLVYSLQSCTCSEEVRYVKVVSSPSASLRFEISGSASRTSQNKDCALQVYLQFFPGDANNNAAFFQVLLATCVYQSFTIVCDRDVQINKAFPITQEQPKNDPCKRRLRENRMRNVHLSAVKNWLCSLTMIWIWIEFWLSFGKVVQQRLWKACHLPVIAAICS